TRTTNNPLKDQQMELIIRIDTTGALDRERLRAEANFVLWVADNLEQFVSAAPGNPASIFAGNAAPAVETAPPAPPVPAAPAVETAAETTPPTPPAPPAATEPSESQPPALDSQGYPWDARIHASTKKQNADGTWSRRRNISDQLWEQVRAELRGAHAGQSEAPADTAAVPGAAVNMVPTPPA